MAQFQTSPGYQFQLDQGLRAVDAGAAANSMLRSGATMKAEQAFGSGLAATEFTNYYNRLFALSQLGETAAAGGAATAGQAASTALQGANAQSSIYGNTAAGLGNTVNSLLSNKDFRNWITGPPQSTFPNNATIGSPYSPSYTGIPSPYG